MSRRVFLSGAASGAASGWAAAADAPQPSTPARGRGLKVFSAGSALYGMRPCAELFTRNSGIAVQCRDRSRPQHPQGGVARRSGCRRGAAADQLDRRDRRRRPGRPGHRSLAIGAVRIGAAVREGAPQPDVTSMDALRRALAHGRCGAAHAGADRRSPAGGDRAARPRRSDHGQAQAFRHGDAAQPGARGERECGRARLRALDRNPGLAGQGRRLGGRHSGRSPGRAARGTCSGGRRPSRPHARCSPSWRRPRRAGTSSPAGSSERQARV